MTIRRPRPTVPAAARAAGVVVAALVGVGLACGSDALAQAGNPARAEPVMPAPSPAQAAAAQAGTPPAGKGAAPVASGNPPPPFGGHAGAQPLVSPPLPTVPGTVPWDLLGQVKTVKVKDRFLPEFPPAVRKLDKQDVKLVGFMLPLQTGEKQSHFLLTVTSQTCAFCVPAGPEGIVEVKAKTPVRVTFDPIVVAGRLEVLRDDPLGVYYRLSDGAPVEIR
ncbi:MAG: hypothetical protein RJA99_2261 [Pseudomonadota bacterium]|jgi:hypothetical protein